MVSFYLWVLGNPMIKSVDILCLLDFQIYKECNSPGLLTLFALTAWHLKHYWTYLWTSLSRCDHQNVYLTSWSVLSWPSFPKHDYHGYLAKLLLLFLMHNKHKSFLFALATHSPLRNQHTDLKKALVKKLMEQTLH